MLMIKSKGIIDPVKRMQFSFGEHGGAGAMLPDKFRVMRHQDHGPVLALFEQLYLAFAVKAAVAHGNDFVDEKTVEVYRQRQGKGQTGPHP